MRIYECCSRLVVLWDANRDTNKKETAGYYTGLQIDFFKRFYELGT